MTDIAKLESALGTITDELGALGASKHDDTIKEDAEETPSKPKKASKETTIDLSTSKRM